MNSGVVFQGDSDFIANKILNMLAGTVEEHHLKSDSELSLKDFLWIYFNRFDVSQAIQTHKLKDFAIANAALGNLELANAALKRILFITIRPGRHDQVVMDLMSCIDNADASREIIDRLIQDGQNNFQKLRVK